MHEGETDSERYSRVLWEVLFVIFGSVFAASFLPSRVHVLHYLAKSVFFIGLANKEMCNGEAFGDQNCHQFFYCVGNEAKASSAQWLGCKLLVRQPREECVKPTARTTVWHKCSWHCRSFHALSDRVICQMQQIDTLTLDPCNHSPDWCIKGRRKGNGRNSLILCESIGHARITTFALQSDCLFLVVAFHCDSGQEAARNRIRSRSKELSTASNRAKAIVCRSLRGNTSISNTLQQLLLLGSLCAVNVLRRATLVFMWEWIKPDRWIKNKKSCCSWVLR